MIYEEIKPLVAECDYPWAIQVACALMNRSTGHVVRKVIVPLLQTFPTPQALVEAQATDVEPIIARCGFANRKASVLLLQARHFADGNPVETCPEMPRYALEAHAIFAMNIRNFEPGDRKLREWLKSQL